MFSSHDNQGLLDYIFVPCQLGTFGLRVSPMLIGDLFGFHSRPMLFGDFVLNYILVPC